MYTKDWESLIINKAKQDNTTIKAVYTKLLSILTDKDVKPYLQTAYKNLNSKL